MKTLWTLAVGVSVGFVLGALADASERRLLQREAVRLERELEALVARMIKKLETEQ